MYVMWNVIRTAIIILDIARWRRRKHLPACGPSCKHCDSFSTKIQNCALFAGRSTMTLDTKQDRGRFMDMEHNLWPWIDLSWLRGIVIYEGQYNLDCKITDTWLCCIVLWVTCWIINRDDGWQQNHGLPRSRGSSSETYRRKYDPDIWNVQVCLGEAGDSERTTGFLGGPDWRRCRKGLTE